MEPNWIEYKCKSGQTMFLYNKVTGEHKWPPGYSSSEDCVMFGQPVTLKVLHSIATQTDDIGCNNGCTSMYINTDRRHIDSFAETLIRQQRQQKPNVQPQLQLQLQSDRQSQPHLQPQYHLRQQLHLQNPLHQSHEPELEPQLELQLEPQLGPRVLVKLENQPQEFLTLGVPDASNTENECDGGNEWNDDNEQELTQDMEEVTTMLATLEQSGQLSSQNVINNTEWTVGSTVVDDRKRLQNGRKIQFIDNEALKLHLRFYKQAREKFQGSYCSSGKKLLPQRRKLVNSTEARSHECPTCKKTFARKCSLKIHMYTHEDAKKPFECFKCKKKFASKYHWQRHMNRTRLCVSST